MYGRSKKMQLTKFSKNFLSLCIVCLLVFLVSSCAGRTGYKQIVSNFWEDESRTSVILRFSEKQVDATTVPGKADIASYAIDTAIDTALWGVGGLLGSALAGPKRKKGDPEFQEGINEIVINTIRAEDDYFVDHFLKKLYFSPPIRPDFKVTSMEHLRREKQEGMFEPADQYLIVDLFLCFSGKEKSWSAKKVWLGATAMLWLIKDKESLHRFLNEEYRLKLMTPFFLVEDVPDIQNERPKIVSVLGLTAFTKDFKKDKWLADNGQFFDEQLKFVLARLASGINKRVLDVN